MELMLSTAWYGTIWLQWFGKPLVWIGKQSGSLLKVSFLDVS